MIRFARAVAPAANAVWARNDGAKPRLTSANAPSFRKILRDVMVSSHPKSANLKSAISTPLKFWRAQRQRGHLVGGRRLRDRAARGVRNVVIEHGFDNPVGRGMKIVPARFAACRSVVKAGR